VWWFLPVNIEGLLPKSTWEKVKTLSEKLKEKVLGCVTQWWSVAQQTQGLQFNP
jgi:hypothetical protein